MIVPAVVAKLNRYVGDSAFERVMRDIESANDEGLADYEVEVDTLEYNCKMDIVVAMEDLGYSVTYTPGDETLYVSND